MLPSAKQLVADPKLCAAGFGLIAKSLNAPLPLTKVDIKAHINESIAKVTFSQTYQNPSDSLLETEYFFPIPPNARFDAFQARYEGTTINGIIKEKERAKKEYQENLDKGNTVAYSEILKESADVMKVQVGNIKPFTEIQITFSYIQKLTIVRGRFYRFVFYSTLGPRYHSSRNPTTQKDTLTLSQYPVLKPKEGYIWNIEVDVKCKSPITYLECQSHKTLKTQDSSNLLEGKLTLPSSDDSQAVFNKNFEVLFNYEGINNPTHRLAKNENGFCAMIDFLPRYDDEDLDDAIKAATLSETTSTTNPDDVNMLTATGEYIFLIDRSGSMDGDRIKMAKEALGFALKSLPPNSFFNVYSFGSSYSALFQTSAKSDENNVNQAIKNVSSFGADMGGTEIYPAIQKILSEARKKNHPRALFLLTDGEVSNPDQVINLIETNSHRARVFSLGIGSGCSTYLVGGCASAGRGKSEFVADTKDISQKVITLMENAFTPVCDDITLEFSDKEVVSMIAPDPQSLTYLLRDEKATFYIFFKNEAIKCANENGDLIITLKNFDTALGGYRTSPIKINLKEYETSLDLFKLGIGEAAEVLEKKSRNLSVKDNPDIYWAVKEGINEELVRLSVENQVLTKSTAFVCVVKENSGDEVGSIAKEKTLIPQVLSNDYSEKPRINAEDEAKFHLLGGLSIHTNSMPMMQANRNASPTNFNKINSLCSNDDEDDCFEEAECEELQVNLDCDYGFSNQIYEKDDLAMCMSEEPIQLMTNAIQSSKLADEAQFDLPSRKMKNSASVLPAMEELKCEIGDQKETKKMKSTLSEKQDKSIPSNQNNTHQAHSLVHGIDKSEKSFIEIIQSQKALGNWDVTSKYLTILGLTQETFLDKVPEAVKNAKGDLEQIAITLLLLVWIERYFESKRGSWSLIHKKGVQWLKSTGVKYSDVSVQVNCI